MKVLSRIYSVILTVSQGAAIICCAGITLLTLYDVMLRNLFNRPVLGAGELTQALLAILLAFGFVTCAHQREHIRVTLFEGKLKRVLPARAYDAWVLGWEVLGTWIFATLIFRHAQHALSNYEYTAVLDLSVGAIFMGAALVLVAAGVLVTIGSPYFWRKGV